MQERCCYILSAVEAYAIWKGIIEAHMCDGGCWFAIGYFRHGGVFV